jgi:hypothetical protein
VDFKRVIWNDECSVEKGKDPHIDWAFRTPYGKWAKEYIQTNGKGGGTNLMV